MRLSRRAALNGLVGVALAPLWARDGLARTLGPERAEIEARPLAGFSPREPERRRFGALNFRSGLVLTSRHAQFGGWSGLARPRDGRDLVAISDHGFWLTARPRYEGARLAGLEDAVIAPVLGPRGRPLSQSRSYDTESLCIADGVAWIGIERTHEVMRFDWAGQGVAAQGRSVPVPPEAKRLPANRSLEAIGVAPPASPLAGSVVAIAERSGGVDEPTLGFILGDIKPGLFKVRRTGGFDITDLAFLPDGDMLVLERWYRPLFSVAMRIRRIPGAMIAPGVMLDGPVLIEADLGYEIDNMEGLAVHMDQGRTVLTLISDDNFSLFQRTLLLEFELT